MTSLPRHMNKFGIRISTPPELILKRIDAEFDAALADTGWSRLERIHAMQRESRRYRLVSLYRAGEHVHLKRHAKQITFAEGQPIVDRFARDRASLGLLWMELVQ